jgi:hypothetical protein
MERTSPASVMPAGGHEAPVSGELLRDSVVFDASVPSGMW